VNIETAQEIGEAQEILKQHVEMVDADLDLEVILLRCMGDAAKEKIPPLRVEKMVELCAVTVEIIERTRASYRG